VGGPEGVIIATQAVHNRTDARDFPPIVLYVSEVVSHALAPSLGVSSWVPRRAPAMSYGIAPKDAQAEIEKGFGVHDEVEGAVAVRERNGG
jgi:hypothetical protein